MPRNMASWIYKKLSILWLIATFIVLLLTLKLNWYMSYEYSNKKLAEAADQITNHVDRFIEDLLQEVYTLPLYRKNVLNCSPSLQDYLERITLNRLEVSGLVIRNGERRQLCSTLPDNEQLPFSSRAVRTILGPVKVASFEQPIYLIQQKIGTHYVSVLVLASILKSTLNTSNEIASSVFLYDQFNKINMIGIKSNDFNDGWVLNNKLFPPLSKNGLYAIDKLRSMEGFSIIVFANKQTVASALWFRELLVALMILLFSRALYVFVKHLMIKRYSLHGAMKLAIKNEEFYPEYQPVFDTEKGVYTGVEVLLRWQNDEDTIIMPDFFIEEAEATYLIVPITLQIIAQAIQETKTLLSQNPDFYLAFNLSACHFTDPNFYRKFDHLIKDHNISPHQILLEITERILLDKNNDVYRTKMEALRQKGYSLAIDDYGTGHASISYLQHFPFDHLKIDKLFVQAIGTKAITESLNDAIIQMAKGLNLVIIAEGVETKEQFDYLIANGVRFLQGWYFSKALPIKQLIRLLREEHHEGFH